MKAFFDMSLLIGFGFLSILLLLGVFLRAKVRFFQEYMVPACLIGGIIGFVVLNTTGFPGVKPELYPPLAYHFFAISFVCLGLRGMSKVHDEDGSAAREMVARRDLAGPDVAHEPCLPAHHCHAHYLYPARCYGRRLPAQRGLSGGAGLYGRAWTGHIHRSGLGKVRS